MRVIARRSSVRNNLFTQSPCPHPRPRPCPGLVPVRSPLAHVARPRPGPARPFTCHYLELRRISPLRLLYKFNGIVWPLPSPAAIFHGYISLAPSRPLTPTVTSSFHAGCDGDQLAARWQRSSGGRPQPCFRLLSFSPAQIPTGKLF